MKYMDSLRSLSDHCRIETEVNLQTVAGAYGLRTPPIEANNNEVDVAQVAFLSKLATSSGLPLPDFVRLVRGQTDADPRPNKDLYEFPRPHNPAVHELWHRWNDVIAHGVVPEWLPTRPGQQQGRSSNHTSINDHLPKVWQHIRKGQRDGRYLVVQAELLEQWPEVFVSPVGVVDKACADGPDIRLINDYSFPEGSSVNDFTDRTNWPEITYNPPGDIARRIFNLRRDHPRAQVMLMLGDVAGAFRHVPIHADHVHMFAFVIGDLLVIDLACGFGWCGSPAWYFVPGALINDSYEQGDPNAVLVPALAGSFWCDDHTCVEVNEGDRCAVANLTLRRAMATVLGPRAINERKFTQWGEQGRALGLLWDTQSGVVTMPLEKIEKAQNRLHDVLSAARVSKTSLQKLLGSLRHVATCCPPARAFYQRVQERASALGRWGHRRLDDPAQEDLKWFRAILQQHQRFNGVSVSTFAKLTLPIVHVHMDASGDGLCVLEPALKQYIRVQYTPEMKEDFTRNASLHSINVRELQSAVLGTLIWGPTWAQQHTERRAHVVFWIDNTSAVSWATRRASRQPLAQLYNRLLSLAEFQYSLVCSAEHVRGVHNVMADAGSRAWNKSHPLYATWTNLAAGWTQVQARPPYDDLSALWARCSEDTPLLTLPQRSTEPIGNNGALSQSL